MKVWGFGARFGKTEDHRKEFFDKGFVRLGFEEKGAPGLFEMMHRIQMGDVIYIKSFSIRGKKLKIEAIGVAKSSLHNEDGLNVISVDWDKKSTETVFEHALTREEFKYNVYNNSVYEELNPSIAKEVLERIKLIG